MQIRDFLRACIFLIATFISSALQSQESFNQTTGELYWDISPEVRLEYNFRCGIVRDSFSSDAAIQSAITKHGFYRAINIFGVLDYYDDIRFSTCKGGENYRKLGESGIRAVYRLREDKLFPRSFSNDITINNQTVEYAEVNGVGRNGEQYDSDNYQSMYSSLQTNNVVTVRIHAWDAAKRKHALESISDLHRQIYGVTEPEPAPLAEVIINTSNIAQSKVLEEYSFQVIADKLNRDIQEKYKFIILYDFIALLAAIASIFIYVTMVHAHTKKLYSSAVGKVKSIRVPKVGVNIIRKESLSSYSVSEELLRWVELKEGGHITEQEFEEARRKILDRK